MSALGQKRTYALQQAMSALHPIATTKADIPWWIGEASVQDKLVAYCPDLKRFLVVVLDQWRPDYAQLPSPARGRRHQLLIGHAVEFAGITHLAAIDDKPQYLRHSHSCRHHRGWLIVIFRERKGRFQPR
jgi:hypothetical protein